jgi:hypothetical protein
MEFGFGFGLSGELGLPDRKPEFFFDKIDEK